jgi:hypothetical protein
MNDKGLSILKASYGTEGNFIDVTKEVKGLVKDGEVDIVVSPQTLGILDPAPGVIKTLQVQHTINGGNKNLETKKDGEQLKLSAPNIKQKTSSGFNIFSNLFTGIIIFIVGAFAIESFHAGTKIFGSLIGWLFLALTLLTFGHFTTFIIPILLLAGWLMSSNYEFPQ